MTRTSTPPPCWRPTSSRPDGDGCPLTAFRRVRIVRSGRVLQRSRASGRRPGRGTRRESTLSPKPHPGTYGRSRPRPTPSRPRLPRRWSIRSSVGQTGHRFRFSSFRVASPSIHPFARWTRDEVTRTASPGRPFSFRTPVNSQCRRRYAPNAGVEPKPLPDNG